MLNINSKNLLSLQLYLISKKTQNQSTYLAENE
jgi:hypothetical protein